MEILMTKVEYSLDDYLQALMKGKIKNVVRPFDSNPKYSVKFGKIASNLYLYKRKPSQFIPLTEEVIASVYDELRPVLNELTNSAFFEWNTTYGNLDSKSIARAYLFNAFNKVCHSQDNKNKIFITAEDQALSELLMSVSDALVEGVKVEDCLQYLSEHKGKKQLESIVSYASLNNPDPVSLLIELIGKKKYVQALKTSMIDAEDFEQALCQNLREPLLNILKAIQDNQKRLSKRMSFMSLFKDADTSIQLPIETQIIKTKSLSDLLTHYESIIHYVSVKTENQQAEFLKSLVNIPFFFGYLNQLPENLNSAEKINKLKQQVSKTKEAIEAHKSSMWINVENKLISKPSAGGPAIP
jgi:hypothetical protein